MSCHPEDICTSPDWDVPGKISGEFAGLSLDFLQGVLTA
jgi:hypothetical protein